MNELGREAWRLMTLAVLAAVSVALLSACATPAEQPDPADYRETLENLNRKRAIQPTVLSRNVHVFEVADNLWVHRSYFDLGGQRLHANGMILLGDQRITIIDAPWTTAAAHDLLDWLDKTYPDRAKRLVVTHAHDDRMGSIGVFAEKMIPVYSNRTAAGIARAKGWAAPTFVFEDSLPLRSGEQAIELFYPGPGHAPGNIVAWFPDAGVLFGGCMVKSVHAETLGYDGDADIRSWPLSLRRVLARYPEASLVIPGHGLPGNTELLTHTIELLED